MEAYRDNALGLFEQTNELQIENQIEQKTVAKTKSKVKPISMFWINTLISLSVVMIIFLSIFYFLGYTTMVRIKSDIKVMDGQNKELDLAINDLQIQLKPYTDKARVETIATKRLGMIYPSTNEIVKIKSSVSTANHVDINVEEDSNFLFSLLNKIFNN